MPKPEKKSNAKYILSKTTYPKAIKKTIDQILVPSPLFSINFKIRGGLSARNCTFRETAIILCEINTLKIFSLVTSYQKKVVLQ